jgi:hypothetical protein
VGRRADRSKLGLNEKQADTGADLSTPIQKLAESYRRTFTSESGADVLTDLKKRFGNRRSFVPDSNGTAFHEGQRDVYLMILGFVERDVNRKPQENEDSWQ